jgi:integrase-like protein
MLRLLFRDFINSATQISTCSRKDSRCSVPECDGANSPLTRQEEDALWEAFFTAAPARLLASQYRFNVKTVLKWRNHLETSDPPMGPKSKSTVLTLAEEAVTVEFRRRTLLPLDDVLDCLKGTIPNLSRSALHPCLQRHGISRLPADETAEKRKRFKTYDIGYVHIDSAELAHADGKVADLPKNREGPTRRFLGPHIFDRVCLEHGTEHRLTKPYHPWTDGQAERMNRAVKEATVRAFHYDDLESLKAHVLGLLTAYNFAKHLKALKWKTPFQSSCDAWKSNPSAFKI